MNYRIETRAYILEERMDCRGTPVLNYRIAYPRFRSIHFQKALARLNQFYRLEALRLQITTRKNLYSMAAQQALEATEKGIPVMTYELDSAFTVTYSQHCALSLYTDQYLYTGGAHGSTTRFSNTWDLKTADMLTLKDLTQASDYKTYYIDKILQFIESEMAAGHGAYFEDYRENVAREFDAGQFYLTPAGVTLYFQPYAIAPYSSGLPEFQIPYSQAVRPPQC